MLHRAISLGFRSGYTRSVFSIQVKHTDQQQERVVWFAHNEITVGRTARNDLRLQEPTVSKWHARIVVKDGKYILVDLKSTNGTYVNKRRIRSPLVIRPERDIIAVGNYVLTISETTNPGVVPARPVPRNALSRDDDAEPTEILSIPFPTVPGPDVTDEERALLALIHDAPEQDGPRLVYADWLIQRGNPRGELVALQCLDHATTEASAAPAHAEPAGAAPDEPTTGQRVRQIFKLLETHGKAWLAPFTLTDPFHCSITEGMATVALEYNHETTHLLGAQLQRGFLAYPLCLTRNQLDQVTPGVFRLTPTLYRIDHRMGSRYTGERNPLYQGQIIGPSGEESKVAIRCSSSAAALDDPRDQGYFRERREASFRWFHSWRLGAHFDHPNVARMHRPGYWGRAGDLALVTEWIDGVSLKALVREVGDGVRELPGHALAAIGYQCLQALAYMRAVEPVDPDLSLASATLTLTPDQVVVARDGTVKFVELPWQRPWHELLRSLQGLGQQYGYARRPRHEPYAAPELRADNPEAPPSDAYHVASLLFQLAGGDLPGYRAHYAPPKLDAILRRAMADDPAGRFASAREMCTALADSFASHWREQAHGDAGREGGRDALAAVLFV